MPRSRTVGARNIYDGLLPPSRYSTLNCGFLDETSVVKVHDWWHRMAQFSYSIQYNTALGSFTFTGEVNRYLPAPYFEIGLGLMRDPDFLTAERYRYSLWDHSIHYPDNPVFGDCDLSVRLKILHDGYIIADQAMEQRSGLNPSCEVEIILVFDVGTEDAIKVKTHPYPPPGTVSFFGQSLVDGVAVTTKAVCGSSAVLDSHPTISFSPKTYYPYGGVWNPVTRQIMQPPPWFPI